MKSYDIFISYRREGGFETAKMVQEKLKSLGYKVFLDYDALRSGKFNEQLYAKIEECKDFILICSPNCFERCKNQDDWLRLEILHALKQNNNIVPVIIRNFEWPKPMPNGLEDIPNMQGVAASEELFEAFMKRLTGFLKAKPSFVQKYLSVALVLFISIIVFAACIWFYKNYQQNRQLEQVANTLVSSTSYEMQKLNNLLIGKDKVVEKWQNLYQNGIKGDAFNYAQSKTELLAYLAFKQKEIDSLKVKSPFNDSQIQILAESDVPIEDVQAFYGYAVTNTIKELENYYAYIKMFAEVPVAGWLNQLDKIIHLHSQIVDQSFFSLYYNLLGLYAEVPDVSYEKIHEFRPYLTQFPESGKLSKEEANASAEKCLVRYEQYLQDLSVITGRENTDVENYAKDVERLLLKAQGVETQKAILAVKKVELSQAYADLIEKCQPKPEDDEWMIWGKMLRLLSAKQNEEALKVLDAFEEYMQNKGDEVKYYTTPVEFFIKDYLWKTYIGGVVVMGFQNDQAHSCIKVGDIIIAINNRPFRNVDEMKTIRSEEGKKAPAKILRLNNQDRFDVLTMVYNENDPLIGLLDLMEILD